MVTPNPTKNREASPQPGWYRDARGDMRWWSGRDWTQYVQPRKKGHSFTFWCLVIPPLWIVWLGYVFFVQLPVAVFSRGRVSLPW